MKDKILARLFGFDSKTHTIKTEIIAGLTTFFTMAYILAVNPEILAVTGMDEGQSLRLRLLFRLLQRC